MKILMFLNKNRLIYIVFFQFFLYSFAFGNGDEEIVPQGFAKIRVWDTDFRNLETGHVSLETNGSYISLWPLKSDPSTTYFENMQNFMDTFIPVKDNTENNNDNPFIKQSPGLALNNYNTDVMFENGKTADHSYIVDINNVLIESIWNNIKNTFGERVEGVGFKFNTIKWYAPGKDVGLDDIDQNNLYFNCASMVMSFLVLGGIDETHVNSVISQKVLWENIAKIFGYFLSNDRNLISKEIGLFLQNNYKLATSIIPSDIKSILHRKIKSDLEIDLRERINYQLIRPNCDTDIAYSKMAEILADFKTKLYISDYEIFIGLISNVGYYEDGNFILLKNTREKIDEYVRNRTNIYLGLGVAATVAVSAPKFKGKKK